MTPEYARVIGILIDGYHKAIFGKRLVWLPCLRPQMSDSVHDR